MFWTIMNYRQKVLDLFNCSQKVPDLNEYYTGQSYDKFLNSKRFSLNDLS